MSLINTQVQPFKTQAFHNGKFIEVSEESLKGHWSVLIFMPAAFTFNCPTEVEDAADNYAEFQKLGTEVYIVTTDTHFSHKVWHETSPAVGKAKFPLVGMLLESMRRHGCLCAHVSGSGSTLFGLCETVAAAEQAAAALRREFGAGALWLYAGAAGGSAPPVAGESVPAGK